jgi:hypothetical protein
MLACQTALSSKPPLVFRLLTLTNATKETLAVMGNIELGLVFVSIDTIRG